MTSATVTGLDSLEFKGVRLDYLVSLAWAVNCQYKFTAKQNLPREIKLFRFLKRKKYFLYIGKIYIKFLKKIINGLFVYQILWIINDTST